MINPNSYISGPVVNKSGCDKMQQKPEQPEQKQNDPPRAEITVSNARRYMSAELSLQLHGPVPDEVFEQRKALCLACPKRYDSKENPDEIGFCKSCGCGVSARSRLTVKLTMPSTECPEKKWGRSHGRHKTLKDRVKSWIITKLI